jgi:TrmH family RNA methyltransferase
VFKSIQSTETSQGIMALVTPRKFDLEQLLAHASSTIVILVGLQDPGNVGTILRIAEAFGSYACLGVKGTASLYNPKVVRASAGSIFRLPHVWDLEFETVVERLNRAQIALIGTSPYGSQSITDWDWTSPAAVLIGNEGAGLSNQQVKACSALLKIPQQPQVESLNSAIAAAVILYEAFRSRGIS